ncbi:hypothetical protein DL96DRAFT_1481328 [Flagelloscypha sp. PMI_526]|nr:hypothetical protein DL96DRAFT_1481328 [Flagelloscypha sp. PMI_526]
MLADAIDPRTSTLRLYGEVYANTAVHTVYISASEKKGNATVPTRSGFGTFWGPGSARNASGCSPGKQSATRAIFAGLYKALSSIDGNCTLRVITSSELLIKTMNYWAGKMVSEQWSSGNNYPTMAAAVLITTSRGW